MSQEPTLLTPTTAIRKQRRTRQRRTGRYWLQGSRDRKTRRRQTDQLTLEIRADSEQETEATVTTSLAPTNTRLNALSRFPKFFSKVDKSRTKRGRGRQSTPCSR